MFGNNLVQTASNRDKPQWRAKLETWAKEE